MKLTYDNILIESPSPKQENKADVKKEPGTAKASKKWPLKDLVELCLPVWQKVFEHIEAHPFHVPVDYVALGKFQN